MTRALLGARARALAHRLQALSARQRLGLALGLVLLVSALLFAGGSQLASLLRVPEASTLPGGVGARGQLIAGAAALDLAFWIASFCGAIFSFRLMEILFRDASIRSVDTLPLPMGALFVDRLARGLLEATLWGALPALFFLPLLTTTKPWVALCCVLLCALSPLATLLSGLGVELFFGGSEFGRLGASGSRRAVDGYGGAGQLFIFAPGAALIASVALTMLLKLSLGEMMRLEAWNRATAVGLSLCALVCAVSVAIAWRHFQRAYFRMLAGFREADFVGFDVPIDYQMSDFERARRGERLLPPGARAAYRRHLLQYGRRFALLRYLYALLWLLYGLALWHFDPEALPSWAYVSLPLVWLATLTNPFARLEQRGVRAAPSQPGRLADGEERLALWLTGAREALLFVGPMALLILALLGARLGAWRVAAQAGTLILLGALALSALSDLTRRLVPRSVIAQYIASSAAALLFTWLWSALGA